MFCKFPKINEYERKLARFCFSFVSRETKRKQQKLLILGVLKVFLVIRIYLINENSL